MFPLKVTGEMLAVEELCVEENTSIPDTVPVNVYEEIVAPYWDEAPVAVSVTPLLF